jgi:zinc/manganese transport system substrate-binding protein
MKMLHAIALALAGVLVVPQVGWSQTAAAVAQERGLRPGETQTPGATPAPTQALAQGTQVEVQGAPTGPKPVPEVPPRSRPLEVLVTIPDLKDFVDQIGGERVRVHSLARGGENLHAVMLRPSDLVRAGRAELFFEIGLSLEHSFVPGLLEAANNPRLKVGQASFVNASIGWRPIEVPASLTRDAGVDIHPDGNPHWNLSPEAGEHFTQKVLAGLIAVDPQGEPRYRYRAAQLLERLAEAKLRWLKAQDLLRGRKLVCYHRDVSYLAAACGLTIVGTIEPKPGVQPSPTSMAALIQRMRDEAVPLILTGKWSNNKFTRFVAQETGASVLELPLMVGGDPEATDWIALMDLLHERLLAAYGLSLDGGG